MKQNFLFRLVNVEPREVRALVLSFLYFFLLLCAYYVLRPVRDEMGIQGGIDKLPWLFTATFIAMLVMVPLYGWVTSRYARQKFLPIVYGFFAANLLIFFVLFHAHWRIDLVAQVFFVWISVFNLFVISVFWSYMNDLFDPEQAKRLFAVIASGGTAGAITGPALTAFLVQHVGIAVMILISACLLIAAVGCIVKLSSWFESQPHNPALSQAVQQPMGGNWLAGIQLVLRSPYLLGIGLLILLYSTLATFLYFQQASIIKEAFPDSTERTAVFAMIDLLVNSLTLILQLVITSRLIKKLGLGLVLSLIPLGLMIGFAALAFAPVYTVLMTVQVIRRAGNYAIMRPAREMLYSVLGREEKYKAKNVIDTVVYRGGDAASAWVYDGFKAMGMSLTQIAMAAIPLAGIWALVSWRLGKQRDVMQESLQEKQDG